MSARSSSLTGAAQTMRKLSDEELDKLVKELSARKEQNVLNALEWVARARGHLQKGECQMAANLLSQALREIGCTPE